MSLLAPFLRSTIAASTLFTAAAQCRADLPEETKTGLLDLRSCNGFFFHLSGVKQKSFTEIIDCIDVSMTVNQLLHHALHCQPGSQDQGCSAIMHTGIQVCGAVPYQNL